MEKRVYEVTEKSGLERPPTEDRLIAKMALKRGATVYEVKTLKSHLGISTIELRVTAQLFLDHFVD